MEGEKIYFEESNIWSEKKMVLLICGLYILRT